MNSDEQAVSEVLDRYEAALNGSDTAEVMALYAPNGVFMPQNSPSSVGAEAIARAYDQVFEAITLRVKFDVAEIKQLGASWAFARTNSAGTTIVNATGQKGPEANQELFLFEKIAGNWKIARYCFSTTNPPRA